MYGSDLYYSVDSVKSLTARVNPHFNAAISEIELISLTEVLYFPKVQVAYGKVYFKEPLFFDTSRRKFLYSVLPSI